MNPTVLALVALFFGIASGFALGWYLGSRPVAEWRTRHAERDAEAKETDGKFREAIVNLAAERRTAERVETIDLELLSLREANAALGGELATLREKTANFEEQKLLLLNAQDALKKEFESAGVKVLADAQSTFINRAQQRFTESEEKSAERLRSLLAPVSERLKSYEDQVAGLEKQRIDAFGRLDGLIETMRLGQEAVRAEAARLGNSLRSAPKASGRWGELQVENVLEKCGLAPHTDFKAEVSATSEDGRIRPDFVVDIPGGKKLIIDAKNIWADYDKAYSTDDLVEQEKSLKAHVQAFRTHIMALSSKSYYAHWEGSAEYVVLFVPGEHLLYAALQQDQQLWNFAFDKNVLLATPTNLVAIAKTVARVWQQVGLEKEAKEIGALASLLYDSLAKTQEDFIKTGTHLGRAVSSFNDFAKTYDGHVLSRARTLAGKHIKIGKRVVTDEVALVELLPKHGNLSAIEEPSEALLIGSDEDEAVQDTG